MSFRWTRSAVEQSPRSAVPAQRLRVLTRLMATLVSIIVAFAAWLHPNVVEPTAHAAACTTTATKRYSTHTVSINADGGHMRWPARTLFASDWDADPYGLPAQVLWVGTNSDTANHIWVEVGVTHGWQGTNAFAFYTAHFVPVAPGYEERLMPGHVPVVGTYYDFCVFSGGTDFYSATVEKPSSWSMSSSWSGHWPQTDQVAGGLEVTYNTSRVDRTNVSQVQFRRTDNGTWTNVGNGTLNAVGTGGSIVWCDYPTKFRYWINSQIDTSKCPTTQ